MNSLVSVFCSRHFSVRQFEIHIILCQYSYHSFLKGSKNKAKFGEINISDCNFLSLSYGSDLKNSEVWKLYHSEYGHFLANDWLELPCIYSITNTKH